MVAETKMFMVRNNIMQYDFSTRLGPYIHFRRIFGTLPCRALGAQIPPPPLVLFFIFRF